MTKSTAPRPRCPVCLAVAVPLKDEPDEWTCSSGGTVVYESVSDGTFRHAVRGGPLFTYELVVDPLRDLLEDSRQ